MKSEYMIRAENIVEKYNVQNTLLCDSNHIFVF